MLRHHAYIAVVGSVNELDKVDMMVDAAENRKEPVEALSIDAARDTLGDLVARADYAGSRTVITRYGKESAAIVSMKDLERLRALDESDELAKAVA